MSKAVSRGQALEVSSRVGTQVNWDELDGDKLQAQIIVLPPEEFGRRFTAFLKSGGQIIGEPTGTFKRDMRKEGWKLLENIPWRITSVDLEAVPFLKDGEGSIDGEELVRRARMELDANYSQEDAERLLENQDKIPEELRPFYMVFTGTVWEGSHGRRAVAYLSFDGGRWILRFSWLGGGFSSLDRLLRPRK